MYQGPKGQRKVRFDLPKDKGREKGKGDLPEDLGFTDDGMTLIMKLIDKQVPAETRTKIFYRLMEPDVATEVKNLAIQLIPIYKFSLMKDKVADFNNKRKTIAAKEAAELAALCS
jgi:hypothetical protein